MDAGHDEAMGMIIGCARVTTLSYEEAIAIYLRMRGILKDAAEAMGAPIPAGWQPHELGRENV